MTRKILHVITTIERGGAEKQLLILIEEQVKSGMTVEVLYLKGKPELRRQIEEVGGVVNSLISNLSFVNQLITLRKYLRRQPVTIHAHLPKSELLVALSCKKSNFIVSRHNAEQFWPKAPSFISRLMSRTVASRAFAVIAISNAVSEFLYARKEVSPHCQVKVIYYGFPNCYDLKPRITEGFSFWNSSMKEQFKIGTIGRLVPQKDYPTLLTGFQIALKIKPNMQLYIVGDGDLRDELEAFAQKLGLSRNVTWLGKIELIDEFLSGLDLFILSSIYEGFGMVILEAMSSRVPVLATNTSAIPEVLGANYPGLFSIGNQNDLARSIVKCFGEEFRQKLVSEYNVRMEIFNSKEMSDKISNIYDSLNVSNS